MLLSSAVSSPEATKQNPNFVYQHSKQLSFGLHNIGCSLETSLNTHRRAYFSHTTPGTGTSGTGESVSNSSCSAEQELAMGLSTMLSQDPSLNEHLPSCFINEHEWEWTFLSLGKGEVSPAPCNSGHTASVLCLAEILVDTASLGRMLWKKR